MESHWICYVEGTDGGRRFRHRTLLSAQVEAERLARLTGKRVYIYEWKGSCEIALSPVTWETPNQEAHKYYINSNGVWQWS